MNGMDKFRFIFNSTVAVLAADERLLDQDHDQAIFWYTTTNIIFEIFLCFQLLRIKFLKFIYL